MDDSSVTRLTARQFGLPEPEGARRLEGGEDNQVVAFTSGDELLVLRRYLLTPADDVAYEVDLVSDLAARGFPTPPPLRRPNGTFTADVGGRPVAVFPFVAGPVPDELAIDGLAEVGALLARLHRLTEGPPRPNARRSPYRARLEALRQPVPLPGMDRVRTAAEGWPWDLLDRLEPLPAGDIHHDVRPQNLIYGHPTTLIDFDEAHHGTLVVDLARLLHAVGWARFPHADPARVAAVLEGYQSVRPLSADERGLLGSTFDLVNLVDAAHFLVQVGIELVTSVDECRSFQLFEANRGRLPLPWR